MWGVKESNLLRLLTNSFTENHHYQSDHLPLFLSIICNAANVLKFYHWDLPLPARKCGGEAAKRRSSEAAKQRSRVGDPALLRTAENKIMHLIV